MLPGFSRILNMLQFFANILCAFFYYQYGYDDPNFIQFVIPILNTFYFIAE